MAEEAEITEEITSAPQEGVKSVNSNSRSQLLPHRGKVSKKAKNIHHCDQCDKQFPAKWMLVNHTRIHTGEKPFPCNYCQHQFRSKVEVETHVRTHTGEKPYKCTDCDQRFRHRHSMVNHRRRFHEPQSEYASSSRRILSKPSQREIFTCGCCKKSLSSKYTLMDHMKIHNGETPLSCGICSRQFRLAQSLEVHMRIHTGEKPYKCSESLCGQAFATDHGFKRHHRRFHEEPKLKPVLTCPDCDKTFINSDSRREHIKFKHEGAEKQFACTYCDKKFTRSSDRGIHMKSHTGEKPYACPMCPVTFSIVGNRNRHVVNVHRDERRYPCQKCDKRFNAAQDLRTHQMVHIPQSERKRYQCTMCDKDFSCSKSLQRHQGERHRAR